MPAHFINDRAARGSSRSIGDLLNNVSRKRRWAPGDRPPLPGSFIIGSKESSIWRSLDRKEITHRLSAAEAYDREHKEAGARNGPLGHVGLEVLRALYRLVDYRTGRLEPSIQWIMSKISRSRDAVVRAMRRLKQHNFLNWIRRTEPIEAEGAGPRVRQITNAYWFALPLKASIFIGQRMKRPVPDDELQREAVRIAEASEMLDRLAPEDLIDELTTDPELREALKRLARAQKNSASPDIGHSIAEED